MDRQPGPAKEQTLEQIRMRYALAVVKQTQEALEKDHELWEKYVGRTRSLPAQVLQNGLNQALAFWLSKAADPSYQLLLQQVDDWLTGRGETYRTLALTQPLAVFAVAADNKGRLLDLMLEHDMTAICTPPAKHWN